MPELRVYLIRHGQVEPNARHVMLGQTDWPLSQTGRAQMAEVAGHLASEGIEAIYSSPLVRCRQSAEVLSESWGVAVRVERDWQEINLGLWDGRPRREIQERFPEEYARRGRDFAGFRPPGGESFGDLLARVLPAFRRMTAGQERALALVGHAGVQRVLLCSLLGISLQEQFSLALPPGGWVRLDLETSIQLVSVVSHPRQQFPPGPYPLISAVS